MSWANTPAAWVTEFATWSVYKKPQVKILLLRPDTEYVTIYEPSPAGSSDHENVKLQAMDDIVHEMPWMQAGSLPTTHTSKWTFLDTDGETGRGTFFAESGGTITKDDTGNPIYCLINYGAGATVDDWRTIFVGYLDGIEHDDDGITVQLHVGRWLARWLDKTLLELPRAFMPYTYVSHKAIEAPGAADVPNGGAFYINSQANGSALFGEATPTGGAKNWPVTFKCWAEAGIPSSWLSAGAVVENFPESTADSAYAGAPCLTIYGTPELWPGSTDAVPECSGLNWAGRWHCPSFEGGSPGDLYTIWPFNLRMGAAITPASSTYGPYPLTDDSNAFVDGGSPVLAGPDPTTWTENRFERSRRFFLAPWNHPFHNLSRFGIVQPDIEAIEYNGHYDFDTEEYVFATVDGTDQGSVSPWPLYNNLNYKDYTYKETSQRHFPDAREDGKVPQGDSTAPWFYVAFSPPQLMVPGDTALKVPDSGETYPPRRASHLNALYAIMVKLGEYQRPPIPEIDGATEYGLQDGWIVSDGYEQFQEAAGSEHPAVNTGEKYLETHSRIPALNAWRKTWLLGLTEDVMRQGASMREVLTHLCKAMGMHLYESPFGQIDFDVAKPLKRDASNYFWKDTGPHVPTFRGSTTGAAPLTNPSSERNCWGIKWADLASKALGSMQISGGTMPHVYGANGLTKVEYKYRDKITDATHGLGDVDGRFATKAVFGHPDKIDEQAEWLLRTFGRPMKSLEFTTSLRFFSDDRTRGASGVLQRLGRPFFFTDTDTNISAYAILTGMHLNPVKGLASFRGHTSETQAATNDCWAHEATVEPDPVALGLYTEETITLVNDGPSAITGTASITDGSGAWTITTGASYNIASGATHQITVRFTPDHAGPDVALLVPENKCTSIPLIGVGAELPICIADREAEFKNTYIGYYRDAYAKIVNYGHGTLSGTYQLEPEDGYGAFTLVQSDGTEVAASVPQSLSLGHLEEERIRIRFRPDAEEEFLGRISIDANVPCATGEEFNAIKLRGTGEPVPDCIVSSAYVNFKRLVAGQNSGQHQLVITNTSSNDLAGTAIIHQGDAGVFVINTVTPAGGATATDNLDGTWDFTLPHGAGNSLTFDLRCNTQGVTLDHYGLHNGILEFRGATECANAGLGASITAQTGPCTADKLSLYFGEVELGDYEDLTVRITNNEPAGGPNITGTVQLNQYGSEYALQTSADIDIAADGGYKDITLRYTPSAVGAANPAWLVFATNASMECPQIGAMGVGALPSCTISSAASGGSANAMLTWDAPPAAIDLGKCEHQDSVVRPGTLSNSGPEAVDVVITVDNPTGWDNFEVTDNHAGTGWATSKTITVPASGTHDYAIRFTSLVESSAANESVPVVGSIHWGVLGCAEHSILNATSVPEYENWDAPQEIDFGYVEIGTARASRQCVFKNKADNPDETAADLDVSLSSSVFSILDAGSKVSSKTFADFFKYAKLATCNLVFEPAAEGSAITGLTANPGPVGFGNEYVTLRGYGYFPAKASTSADQINFGQVLVGETVESATLTITNPGGTTDGQVAMKIMPTVSGTQDEFDTGGSWTKGGGTTGPDGYGYYDLPKNGTLSNTIEYTPTDGGVSIGHVSLGIYTDVRVTLFGEGATGRKAIEFFPTSLAINGWVGETAEVTLEQINQGVAGVDDATVEGTVILNGPTGMEISKSASGGASVTWEEEGEKGTYEIPPGGKIVWTVEYTPKTSGNVNGELIFTEEDVTIPIACTALSARSSVTPSEIPGLRGEYHLGYSHGISDGNTIQTLTDQSGKGNDLSQATSSMRPIVNTSVLNGHDVLTFDGVDDNLASAASFRGHENDAEGGCGFTAFCVGKYDNTGGSNQHFASEYYYDSVPAGREWRMRQNVVVIYENTDAATPYSLRYPSLTSGTWYTVAMRWKTLKGLQAWVNETSLGVSTTTITDIGHSTVKLLLGGQRHGASEPLKGQIAHFLIFARYLTDEEMDLVHEYLRARYAHYT